MENETERKIICPECGADMILRTSTRFRFKNGDPRPFYGCAKWPNCNATHGAHPNGKPLGTPARLSTKQARIRAHDEFDKLWKSGKYSRREAYELLAKLMNREEVHFGSLNEVDCNLAIDLLKQFRH